MSTKLFMRNDSSKILPAIRVCANASGEELNRLSTIPILVQNVSDLTNKNLPKPFRKKTIPFNNPVIPNRHTEIMKGEM